MYSKIAVIVCPQPQVGRFRRWLAQAFPFRARENLRVAGDQYPIRIGAAWLDVIIRFVDHG